MTPYEVMVHIEEAQPKRVNGLSDKDYNDIIKRREELEAKGEKVW